jgi:hypothetical protein
MQGGFRAVVGLRTATLPETPTTPAMRGAAGRCQRRHRHGDLAFWGGAVARFTMADSIRLLAPIAADIPADSTLFAGTATPVTLAELLAGDAGRALRSYFSDYPALSLRPKVIAEIGRNGRIQTHGCRR